MAKIPPSKRAAEGVGSKKGKKADDATPAKKNASIKAFFQRATTTKKPVVTVGAISTSPKSSAAKAEGETASSSSSDEDVPGPPLPSSTVRVTTKPPTAAKSPPSKKTGMSTAAPSIRSPAKPALPDGATECTFPCPEIGDGWTQRLVARKPKASPDGVIDGGNDAAKAKQPHVDRYFFAPEGGRKFRSMVEVRRFLNGDDDKTAPTSNGASKSAKKAKGEKSSLVDKKSPSVKEEEKRTTPGPRYSVGTIVSKVFKDEDTGTDRPFSGTVTSYDPEEGLYSVTYEDGDTEDMSERDLETLVDSVVDDYDDDARDAKKRQGKRKEKVSAKRMDDDGSDSDGEIIATKKKRRTSVMDTDDEDDNVHAKEAPSATDDAPLGRGSRRSAKKKVIYYTKSDSEMESEEDSADEALKSRSFKKKVTGNNGKGGGTRVTKGGGGKKRMSADSDSDEFQLAPDAEDEDESIAVDSESDLESEDSVSKKAKKGRGKKAAPARKKTTSKKSCDDGGEDVEEETKGSKSVSGSIEELCKAQMAYTKPLNNPQKLPKAGPYVDPVGIDATDGIVEGIIGRMVQKVGKLLLASTKRVDAERELGELNFPIKLNTACSGTDAPSIALGLVKESLDRFCNSQLSKDESATKDGHGFDYEHNMSCEIEPFKQAYIGRNFPGVLLFPDITKLTEKETVVDVYGREQSIPEANMFIAGTSCKDFSMLKSNHRKDIEDKGTSGQTFLAAVEYLEQEQPSVALFENVENAPWEKMQEYIRGRLHLSERNSLKNITGAKKANADKELLFSVNEDGRYVVEKVPPQVGVRAGCLVQGFVRSDDEPDNVQPLNAKKSDKDRVLNLGQLAKEHRINLEEDILVVEKKARYCTHLIRLDTKDYGLPQTRNRQYLFVWRSDDPSDNLGEYFQLLMDHFKMPLHHSMEAFLLPPTHDRIRCFREALRSGPGLMVAKERAKENDFFDWELTGVKDLAHHLNTRSVNGVEERSRWLTQWNTRGRKVAPGLWPELVAMWNMRRCDFIDTFAALTVRDAVSRDSLHHSFTWDISQNVNRTSVRNSTVGVSGCVTPGGELLLPNKGRTMMGFEKLLLQGIPFTRLALGPETEVQLSDLAGNAMSMTVVCAAILSAICAPQLRREEKRIKNVNMCNYHMSQKYDSANGAVLSERGDLYGKKVRTEDFHDIFSKIANDLALDAFQSSVLCSSESSGQMSQGKILECTSCGFGICDTHTSLHQIESHNLKEVVISGKRANPHEFEMKIRCLAPSAIVLGKSWEESVSDCEGLESYSFQLQRVDRMRGHWLLTYGAWEDHGSGRQVAEIRVALGQLGRLEKNFGLAVYLKCFAPAIRLENPQRGVLKDAARLFLNMEGKSTDGNYSKWEIREKPIRVKLNVVGSDPCDSQRVQIGVKDHAADALKKHTPMNRFTESLPKSRNSLVQYHPKWKTWPGTIVVSGDDSGLVNGTYRKMSCQHSVVLSALWRRDPSGKSPALYIYIRPDVVRSDLDVTVISKTPSYLDKMEICELKDWIPENALVEKTHSTEADFLSWKPAPDLKVEVLVPTLVMKRQAATFHEQICTAHSESPILCEMSGLSREAMKSILQHSCDADNAEIIPIDLVGKMGSRNAKRLSILGAPLLLKYAAEGMLPLELLHWYRLSHPEECRFGLCEVSFPSRPQDKWREVPPKPKDKGPKYEREFDAVESNEFYQKLLGRPPVFQLSVDKPNGKLIIRMNPIVAGHQAAAHLIRGRGLGDDYAKSVDVCYCLSELARMGEPFTKEFHVPNSDAYEETQVEGMVLPLYPRQAKALTRMQAIEAGQVEFSEEERSEHILNGVGWCLIGRATKKSPLKGGVLGDAIGSGKTVVTIALILSRIKIAREKRSIPGGRSGATLIVVPPGLVQQWDDERKKFSKDKLKSIIIDSTNTLKRFSVKDICEADMVIVPAGIIEERGKTSQSRPYTELMSMKAGSRKIPPAPSNGHKEAPTIEGTWVRNMNSGPAIYVGNDAKQKHRDEQAFYGHRYSEAIKLLRQQNFSASERGVPLEWFTWDRIVVDECHECLVSTHKQEQESKASEFKGQARRGAREFLGVGCTDSTSRPLLAESGVWGLTGTPLLETEARVTELANLMGGTYLTGSAHHWRREERESGRDIFLNQQEEGSKSREYRCAIQESCHAYVREACQRNRGEALDVNLERIQKVVNMSQSDGEKFLSAIKEANLESYSITPEQLGDKAGKGLTVTASATARHSALFEIIDSIQANEPHTKTIIFANAVYSGYTSALVALKASGRKFSHVDDNHSVLEQNEIISWFRHTDATAEDRLRPRILLLSFSQAAGHNLQEDCHNVIMYDPMYSGSDAVADASVEEQALGRVMRQGQTHDVTCYRIIVRGPKGESCLDDVIVKRNMDEEILRAATSNFD